MKNLLYLLINFISTNYQHQNACRVNGSGSALSNNGLSGRVSFGQFIEFDKISPTRECIILNSGSEMCTELADRKIVTKIGVIVPKDVQSYFITYSVCSFENHCVTKSFAKFGVSGKTNVSDLPIDTENFEIELKELPVTAIQSSKLESIQEFAAAGE